MCQKIEKKSHAQAAAASITVLEIRFLRGGCTKPTAPEK